MRILITGNMGYVGPVVVEHLRQTHPDATLVGYDAAWFAGCLMDPRSSPDRRLDRQLFGDVRDLSEIGRDALAGVDAVVHLAGISNDPMGSAFERLTADINHRATLEIAARAREARVGRFVLASSCSVYGATGEVARHESSDVQPLTAYARSKVRAEEGLLNLADDDFAVTCLRFATACGWSPRPRLDLVLNDFVASATTSGRISILSDGTPWRPLIDVRDMARAIEWAAGRDADQGGAHCVVNAGSDRCNYRIAELAELVASELGDVEIEIEGKGSSDARSYRVDFQRFAELAPDHQPRHDVQSTVRELAQEFAAAGFADPEWRSGSAFVRLRHLETLRSAQKLDDELRWT